MNNKTFRTAISKQCGFNKARLAYYDESTDSSNYANPLYIVTYPDGHTLSTMQESLAQKKVIEFNSKQGEKTQPQRLLESIIPNKADDSLEKETVSDNASHETGETLRQFVERTISEHFPALDENLHNAIQVCNAGDWPTVEDQQRYWQERDEHLDRTEATCLWFDKTQHENK